MSRCGQIVVVIAVLIPIVLLMLAVAVDAGRLYIERARLRRAAQAGVDAGLGWVAEQMVTLAVPRQTAAAERTPCTPDAGFGTPNATCTGTPPPDDIPCWLTDEDRAFLVSPPMRETAQAVARHYASQNDLDASDETIQELTVDYPYLYDPNGETLRMQFAAKRLVTMLLAGLLGRETIEVPVEVMAEIPLR
jgi:hypothetical protein